MTTAFATLEDMLEVLDANPSLLDALRARILTRELLDLPQAVAELAASQVRLETALRAFMEATNARLDALENSVAEIIASQVRLETTLREFMEATNARLDALENSVAELAASQMRLETALREFMEATNARLDALENSGAKTERNLVSLNRDVAPPRGHHLRRDRHL